MFKTLLTTHDVAYATSIQELFSKVSVTIKEGDRIGLIGKNGTGKTTFIKILKRELKPDLGTVVQNGTVGYVPQISNMLHQDIDVDELLQKQGLSYEHFCAIYQSIFPSSVPNRSVGTYTISGGEFTKIWIALVVANDPSILLLDEPTNHLDQKSIVELEEWLNKFKGGVLFVSHNRYFLSHVARIIWELDSGTITVFGGSYRDFLIKKQYDTDAKMRQYEAIKKNLKSLERGMYMRETKSARAAKVSRKNKAEPSRSKSAENYFRNRSEKGIGKIKKKHDDQRAKLEMSLEALSSAKSKTVNLPLISRSKGKRLLFKTKDLVVHAGSKTVVADIDLQIKYGDRVSISGDNGTGKSLLIRKLMQEINSPTRGVSKIGSDVKIGFIDQLYEIINAELTVFENLEQRMNVVDQEYVYKQIGRFQFPEYYARKKAYELSGGEMARLAFAIATIAPLDLLILDEPTNNLDIETMDVILSALNEFKGSLLIVSHDTFFLDSLGIKRKYVIKDGTLVNV